MKWIGVGLVASLTCSSVVFADEPFSKIGTTILCEAKDAVGFDWEKSKYVQKNFNLEKYLFRIVAKDQCPLANDPPLKDLESGDRKYRYNYACMKFSEFGEEPMKFGETCLEMIAEVKGEPTSHQFACDGDFSVPYAHFAPNGLFHKASIHSNLSKNPKDGYKDSQVIEWGVCSVVSE